MDVYLFLTRIHIPPYTPPFQPPFPNPVSTCINPYFENIFWNHLPTHLMDVLKACPNLSACLQKSKTKNDLSMKLSSQKHVSFFSCLICVTWCGYDVILMTTPSKLCKLEMQQHLFTKNHLELFRLVQSMCSQPVIVILKTKITVNNQ